MEVETLVESVEPEEVYYEIDENGCYMVYAEYANRPRDVVEVCDFAAMAWTERENWWDEIKYWLYTRNIDETMYRRIGKIIEKLRSYSDDKAKQLKIYRRILNILRLLQYYWEVEDP